VGYGYGPVLWAMPLLGLLAVPIVLAGPPSRVLAQPEASRP